jgi:hypothetical protein
MGRMGQPMGKIEWEWMVTGWRDLAGIWRLHFKRWCCLLFYYGACKGLWKGGGTGDICNGILERGNLSLFF